MYFSSTSKLKIKGVKGAAYLPEDGSWNKPEETTGNSPEIGPRSSMHGLPFSSDALPKNLDPRPSNSSARNPSSSHPTPSNTPSSPLNASQSHTNSNSSPQNPSSDDSTTDTAFLSGFLRIHSTLGILLWNLMRHSMENETTV